MLYTKSEIKEQVYEAYMMESVELSSCFFDFDVRGEIGMLLRAYTEIQNTINSDEVVLLNNVSTKREGDYIIVSGDLDERDFDEIYHEVYEGNYKDFLESYNEKEKETRLYRLLDPTLDDKRRITGTKLDFIW